MLFNGEEVLITDELGMSLKSDLITKMLDDLFSVSENQIYSANIPIKFQCNKYGYLTLIRWGITLTSIYADQGENFKGEMLKDMIT